MAPAPVDWTRRHGPGLIVVALVATAAQFVADHYGAPAMLMALLFGIAINFLGNDGPCRAGLDVAARTILRLGVALLGFRISFAAIAELGCGVVIFVMVCVALTILSGIALAPLFGHRWRFGVLSAGAVAICGASAAVAIAAVLPRDERSDDRLAFTIASVTILSNVAMVLYPIIANATALSDTAAGLFIGASIHDVAQVVGAGFSMSSEIGETATVTKLLRVALLAPTLVVLTLCIRCRNHEDGARARRFCRGSLSPSLQRAV